MTADILPTRQQKIGMRVSPVVLADRQWALPALGCGFLPKQIRKRSRNAALRFSKVPLILHWRK